MFSFRLQTDKVADITDHHTHGSATSTICSPLSAVAYQKWEIC